MKIDRLFLALNDIESSQIKSLVDLNKVLDDEFRGKDDQELLVYSALSLRASKDLLSHFDISSDMPVLLSHKKKKYKGYLAIEEYLTGNDFIEIEEE